MKTPERSAYVKSQWIANLVINSILNGAIAILAYQARGAIPLAEMAIDILITIAIIAFFVGWIGTAAARKQMNAVAGSLPPRRLPSAVLRALLIMLALMLVYGGLGLIGPLSLLAPLGLSNWGYILLKTLYTGGCAVCASLLAMWGVFRESQI